MENNINEKLNIVYEDNHIIVVVKPQNLLSQSDITEEDDMLSIIKQYIKEKFNKPGEVFIGLVHRLDRPTGGLMIFARNSKAAARLSKQMAENDFNKEYLAVVENKLRDKEARLVDYIKKDEKTNMVKLCPRSEKGVKQAILNYKVIDEENEQNLSLLKVNIETGRPHQIRVQLSNIKNPIYGDYKYGAVIKGKRTNNLALWAYKLEFVHPVTKAVMKFTSLPEENKEPWVYFKLENLI